jgi:hypothetical protein
MFTLVRSSGSVDFGSPRGRRHAETEGGKARTTYTLFEHREVSDDAAASQSVVAAVSVAAGDEAVAGS